VQSNQRGAAFYTALATVEEYLGFTKKTLNLNDKLKLSPQPALLLVNTSHFNPECTYSVELQLQLDGSKDRGGPNTVVHFSWQTPSLQACQRSCQLGSAINSRSWWELLPKYSMLPA